MESTLPQLTKEEWVAFKKERKNFFKKYKIIIHISLCRQVAMSLTTLAVYKALGIGYEKNVEEARKHYFKACLYYPAATANKPSLRRILGLTPD